MWSKYTGVLIWNAQNPWTGLRGQFYDHLLDQTAGFYGCCCAAEPIHVQLNLATYFIEVISTLISIIIYETDILFLIDQNKRLIKKLANMLIDDFLFCFCVWVDKTRGVTEMLKFSEETTYETNAFYLKTFFVLNTI
ncbi:mannosylglycoprotein endo-beta-mannosidase [Quercus suber]|uniref:Mannosylglycoprotein endo-beta-mannosidase n=1 Tax=Quercus suber TaxID=58331 RepID=A0AAW0JQ34_QUESU